MMTTAEKPISRDQSACAPRLQRAGVASYHADDPALLAAWLEAHGWQRADPRSQYEYTRLWCGAQLVVLYASGTCLIQGLLPERTHALLSGLEIQHA